MLKTIIGKLEKKKTKTKTKKLNNLKKNKSQFKKQN